MLLPLVIGVIVLALGVTGWRMMNAGRPPALPEDLSAVDPEVANLVRTKAARIEADPTDGRAHGSLGLVYEANTMWPEAVRSFANAAALDPDEPLWAYHQARATINSGDDEAGHALLFRTAVNVPDAAGVQLYLAHALLDAGEYDGAEVALENVVRLFPNRPEGYAGQGELLLAREEYAAAAHVLRRALEIDPSLTIAHYSLGLAYREMGQLEDAERELTLGLGAKRRGLADKFGAETQGYGVNYVGVINRSSDLVEAGQYQTAVDILQRLRSTRPDDANLLNNLGIAYTRLKQYAPALEHLLHALEIDPDFFGTHLNLAACYRDAGDLEKALAHAQRGVELAGDKASSHFSLMRILARLKRFDEALVAGEAAVRLDPGDATKHATLGELTARLGRPLEARDHFKAALELVPSFLPARINLVRIHVGLGELDQAEATFAMAERAAPTDPRVQECKRLIDDARRQRAAGLPPRDG